MKHTLSRRALPVTALALAAGLVLAGCGSDDADSAASPSPSMSQSMDAMANMPTGASATVGDFKLENFWVKESSLDMSGGFGTIVNNGAEDDALIGAKAPGVPEIQLHETVDGVMQQVTSFPVPAGGALELKPGANHLMFMGLTQPLQVGETIEITLEFASGIAASITAPIEPFTMDDGTGDM